MRSAALRALGPVAALVLMAVVLALPATAGAAGSLGVSGFSGTTSGNSATTASSDPNALTSPPTMDQPPPGHRLTGDQVQSIAAKQKRVQAEIRDHKGAYPNVYLKGVDRWQVSWFTKGKKANEIVQVIILDATGKVQEVWTGPQIAWTMARGYPGAFGRKVNLPIIWIPLMIVFLVPFIDWKRLFRIRHLDLLVLSAFSLSLMFFNRGEISTSTPLMFPLLGYFLLRLLYIGLRRKPTPEDREPFKLYIPVTVLAVMIVFLLGFRIGLNVVDSNVIDVGYSGVIGGHRLTHGQSLYGNWPKDDERGDTYGPAAYAAYAPFEAIWPWHGSWDDLESAHAAAIFFDVLCVVLLFLLGRQVRGPTLGVLLAYAWVAFPFTLYALNTNSNDSLVAAAVIAVMLFSARPPIRGALGALAGMVKFAPLAMAPVLATYDPSGKTSWKKVATFCLGFGAMLALLLWPVLAHTTLHEMYERTVAYQADRGAPFSIWGLYDWKGPEKVAEAVLVLMAVVLAFVPRRRDIIGLAALCGAIVVGLEMTLNYWFYLYIVWFFPLVMFALLARYRFADERPEAAAPSVVAEPAPYDAVALATGGGLPPTEPTP
jgi:hypothetical protein